ncbi:transcriptional regulator, TetR family [Mucilaginibacter lappiensis]|uniref:TetR/AcrR family transcriptional repressor of nem operon n=1 Tax=Mucilaginibacter lappiensis TaxID=354630 RepID=A0ABR6PFL5_9SPHI|nr:TetR/AcrR family transcriptional regulator [Mucilaginibacter lappiensis]MBB6108557.1 TetR/AcrR family transcriptional repressor of nem operon [Mucilaginibacter lappiensis]SIQ33322.1 transcriptional regulator, TetR family [Mucilaginibacter lappiensis]
MRGRPNTFKHEEVVIKAQQAFWTKGFTATSLEDVLEAMNMGSGSFYNAFKGGKKELFRQAVNQRRQAFKQFAYEVEKSNAPVDLIKGFFRSLAHADTHTHRRGCLIANTIVEMAGLDAELENENIAILKDVEQLYTQTIAKAQKNGTLKNQTNPALLGRYLINLYNGLNVTRRMYPDQQQLSELIEMQLEIIR